MSSIADRLRDVVRPMPGIVSVPPTGESDSADVILGGVWHEVGGHRCLVIDRAYAPEHRHGQIAIGDAAPANGAWSRLHLLAPGAALERSGTAAPKMLFVDLETTGLAGGAGTYAFLVGCAWFEGTTFRVRQFFLSAFASERMLLEAVADVAASAGAVATYNGKTFDLPLMETRYVLHRMPTPFAALPHVDMLHPARRLWRSMADETGGESSCTLAALERRLCGHERVGDVPGFEIPSRYFHYVRSGDARALTAVFEHNRQDLLSLACFTARAARLLRDGVEATETVREAVGIGRLYERGGMSRDAAACYRRASEMPGDVATRAEALRARATLDRRERRYAEAAEAWQQLIELPGCPASCVREAAEALAVHHEHRVRDLESARGFALQSLRLPGTAPRKQATEHRLARLSRKLGLEQPAELF